MANSSCSMVWNLPSIFRSSLWNSKKQTSVISSCAWRIDLPGEPKHQSFIVVWWPLLGLQLVPPQYGPLARYVKLRVAYAPGILGTFSPPPPVSDPDMHHGTCVTHVSWCMPWSLTSGFLWSRWRGKRSLHSRCTRNPQCYEVTATYLIIG